MDNKVVCPNCGTALKRGLVGSNSYIDQYKIDVINVYHDKKCEFFCKKCGNSLYQDYNSKLKDEINSLHKEVKEFLEFMPCISSHNPLNWDYDIIDLVTGQSTTGTGIITEFTSSWSDFMGRQSGMHNKKLRQGEKLCLAQVKYQTLDLGGNAIIASDIDYAEIGSLKGMLMVCISGTAIKLKNPEIVLGKERTNKIEELKSKVIRLEQLQQLNVDY